LPICPIASKRPVDLNAPVARVWKAITDHREFGEWFRVKLDAPFVAGAVSSGHITYPGYEHVRWQATVKRWTSPPCSPSPGSPMPSIPPSTTPRDPDAGRVSPWSRHATGTRLTITESGFDKVPEYRRAEAFRMNDGGWAEQIRNIKDHVER
jgi:hypothetical protein